MGQDLSISDTLRNQLERMAIIASDSCLSIAEKKKRINEIIETFNEYYKGKPTVYLYPDDKNYFIIHIVLKNGDHILYINHDNKGQVIIIHSLKEHEEIIYKGEELMDKIKKSSTELKNNLSKNYDEIDNQKFVNAIKKVEKLIDEIPSKILIYINKIGGINKLQSVDLLNKISQYLEFGKNLTHNKSFHIPIDGDIIHNLTGNILNSIKLS
jgi:hypothetical protein